MAGAKRRSVSHPPLTPDPKPEARPQERSGEAVATTTDNPAGCFLRLYWMGIGNFALIITAVLAGRQAAPSLLDGIYVLVALSLILARYVDVSRFGGQTTNGDPATLRDWRRHVAILVPVAAALWWAARFAHAQKWL